MRQSGEKRVLLLARQTFYSITMQIISRKKFLCQVMLAFIATKRIVSNIFRMCNTFLQDLSFNFFHNALNKCIQADCFRFLLAVFTDIHS